MESKCPSCKSSLYVDGDNIICYCCDFECSIYYEDRSMNEKYIKYVGKKVYCISRCDLKVYILSNVIYYKDKITLHLTSSSDTTYMIVKYDVKPIDIYFDYEEAKKAYNEMLESKKL